MTRACLVAILALYSIPAWAQSNGIQIYEPGGASCATYLQDHTLCINADGWLLGLRNPVHRDH